MALEFQEEVKEAKEWVQKVEKQIMGVEEEVLKFQV